MPYSDPKSSPAWVHQHGMEAMAMWVKVFNSAFSEYKDEGKAIATANAAVKEKYMKAAADSSELSLFIPITKIDETKRVIYGRITDETLDKSGEAFDYASSKPHYEAWSAEIAKATDGKSVGNLRAMHTSKVAGKLIELSFNDAEKTIECAAKVLDDAEWNLCLEGAYTGLSQGGRYKKRWTGEDGVKRYTVSPSEVSLVDNPCLGTARFELVKADGTVEAKPFKEHGSLEDEAKKGAAKGDPDDGPEPEPEPQPEPAAKIEGIPDHSDYMRRKAGLRTIDSYLEKEIA
jgi:cation transport regulator ChaB